MRVVAVLVLALSLLPIANWVPGGHRDTGAAARLEDWALGTALCAVVGFLVWFLRRRRALPPVVTSAQPARRVRDGWRTVAVVALGGALLYATISQVTFSGRALLMDEVVQGIQARDLAAGRLTHKFPADPAFFLVLNEVWDGARAYGQYPVGGPAMFVPGVWLGMRWAVGPVIGGLCVLLFWLLIGHTDPLASVKWRRAATALFAVTPFAAFQFASQMSHAAVLLWLLLATVALARATNDEWSPWWGLVVGLGFGCAATVRPLDALAFALPAGLWLLSRTPRSARARRVAVLAVLGILPPLALLLLSNALTTGSPLRFGYDVLWGASHALGFHATPWGPVHTPLTGLELVSLYFSRLNTFLFETPFPALLLPALGFWFSGHLRSIDRYLLVSAGLLVVGYWAYWHDGFFLGPRFLFPMLPLLVLWSARSVPALRDRVGRRTPAWEGLKAAAAAAAVLAVINVALVREPTYRNGWQSMRAATPSAARAASVSRALVLVQESWGAQVIARMWALGVAPFDSERLYAETDLCTLSRAVQDAEMRGLRGADVVEWIEPLRSDAALLEPRPGATDRTQQWLPGLAYEPACLEAVARDELGFLTYAPWRLVRDSNVYARWIPGREAEVASAFPGRAVYLLRRAGAAPDAPLVWERLTVAPSGVAANNQ